MRHARPLLLLTGLLASSAAVAGPVKTPPRPKVAPSAAFNPRQRIQAADAVTPALAHAKTLQVTETAWHSVYKDEKPGPLQATANYAVKIVLPDKVWIEAHPVTEEGGTLKIEHPSPASLSVCDGKTKYLYNRHTNQFYKTDTVNLQWGHPLIDQGQFGDPTFVLFMHPNVEVKNRHLVFQSYQAAGQDTLNGRPMRLLAYTGENYYGDPYSIKIWVDL